MNDANNKIIMYQYSAMQLRESIIACPVCDVLSETVYFAWCFVVVACIQKSPD